ncbi:MAG: hypothetical protein M1829_001028 [Trizodia sp. TS-e1964]|nr:MAG: hypothetical protein M1829_001028 [Trizodia sp. TS-e1964]
MQHPVGEKWDPDHISSPPIYYQPEAEHSAASQLGSSGLEDNYSEENGSVLHHHSRFTRIAHWLRRSCHPSSSDSPTTPNFREGDPNYYQTYSVSTYPIPGNGSEPPYLPEGAAGGAAARAAAAAQNERLGPTRFVLSVKEYKGDRDRESGVDMDMKDHVGVTAHGYSTSLPMVRADPVEYLPSELVEHLFTFVDHHTLLRSELVSRTWRKAVTSHHTWKKVFLNEQPRALISTPVPNINPMAGGRGLGKRIPNQDWKRMFQVRENLRRRWENGHGCPSYLEGHTDSVYVVQFDDYKAITGSRDRTIRVWDIHTLRCIRVIYPQDTDASTDSECVQPHGEDPCSSSDGHKASVLCLQYDDKILVTGSSDSTCIVWSINENYKRLHCLKYHTAGVLDVCFDEVHIVTCSKDTSLCIWDRATGEFIRQLCGHSGPVNAVQVRGSSVASCSGDGLVKLWSLDSGNCVREFIGHTRGLACVQFSEDSKLIISGGNDESIRVWEANTGNCIYTLHGHTSLVRSLHLNCETGTLVTGSYDKSIKVYDIINGRLLLDFPGWHSSWILSAKADYRRIVSASQDGRVMIQDFGAGLEGVEMLES